MSEEIKKEVTEEVTEKQEETTAVTTTEANEEQPKEEPKKKGLFQRVTESKAVKVVGTALAIVGLLKVGETIGEKKAQREFNENIVDVEAEPSSEAEEVSE